MAKDRLDTHLVNAGLFESRAKAQGAIMAGLIFVNGRRVDKPGQAVPPDARIEMRGEPLLYVSRGGLKLVHALDQFGIVVEGRIAADIGASTGGFTDCLLQRGVARVYAIDVGYGQLHWRLRNDPRVVVMERTNARYLTPSDLPEAPHVVTIDASFISLTKILPAVHILAAERADIICLVKPQFEATSSQVGKRGVVKDPKVHQEVLAKVASHAVAIGFQLRSTVHSPIKGPQGNIEYLMYLHKPSATEQTGNRPDDMIASDLTSSFEGIVEEAHRRLNQS